MIKNTELLYVKMKQFQDKRAESVSAHKNNLKALERFKGSIGYDEDLKRENDRFEAELKTLRDEYRPGIQTVFGGMMEAIGKRSVSAPTTDHVNLLNVLKMKKNVTKEELERVAEAVKDNPIALSVVTEIAHDHGIMRSFDALCPEMSSQRAADIVTGMKATLEDYLQYDTPRASRLAKEYYDTHYGETVGELKKRKLFTDQTSFYCDEMGLDAETLRQLSDIVDH